MYRLRPVYTPGSSGARLIPVAIFTLLVGLSCGGFGIQIWQRSGPAMAAVTLIGATVLVLGALAMIVFGIRELRAHRLSTPTDADKGAGK